MADGSAPGAPEVLYADRHVVVVLKPSGLDVHGRGPDDPDTLVAAVAALLGLPPRKLHPAARLDKPVSGLVPLARSKVGRKALTEQYQARRVSRTYLALSARAPEPDAGTWALPIGPDPRDPRRRATSVPGAEPAVTVYRVAARLALGAALVELRPRTGRTHQLRVHLAAAGCPILGDRRYGGPPRLTLEGGAVLAVPRVMLHAARLEWLDPVTGAPRSADAPPPADMAGLLAALVAHPT